MTQGAAPRLQVKIKGQCRWVTPALDHGQNSTSGACSIDVGPLHSFTGRWRAKESELCGSQGSGGWRPGSYYRLLCILPAEGWGVGRDLKPDLPLAQQLFMPDNMVLGRTTTVACVAAQGIYDLLLCSFTICKMPPAFTSSFILLLFVFCRVKYSFG